ncbi:MAG: STAS domain-containing protein [Saprospiraceae bacterium]|nr:STAS domain-containing protein [Saprospiraceae bacterium]
MKYSIDKQDRYAIMTLDVENLNSIVAPDLKSEFVIFRNEGIPNFILNLSNVKYVDSSGLSAILTGNRLWKGAGTFIVTGVQHAAVKKLIEISRLDTILQVIPSVSEATDYIYMDQLEKELEEE